jgi:hypothetical protein
MYVTSGRMHAFRAAEPPERLVPQSPAWSQSGPPSAIAAAHHYELGPNAGSDLLTGTAAGRATLGAS